MFEQNSFSDDFEQDGSASWHKRFWHNGKNKVSGSWRNFQNYNRNKKIAVIGIVTIAVVFLTWAIGSKTSGEVASLYLSPASSTVTAGTNFNVAINIDTKNNNVVLVRSVLIYNPAEFQLVSYNTGSSVFSSGNTCQYQSKPCEIVSNDTANGKITIVLAKPTPGIKTSNGLVANLTFKPLKAIVPSADNLTLQYLAFNNYTDSDVIFDDGRGTDILSEISNSKINSILPVPTGLAGTGNSATRINLTWNSPTNIGITGFKIYRGGVLIRTSDTPVSSYTDTGLAPNTAYSYRVKAFDAENRESALTSSVSVSTLPDTTAPSVPNGLASSNVTMNSVNLSWNASTDDVAVTGYDVFRNGTKISDVNTTSYHDSGLSPETTYTYKVLAHDAASNNSSQSSGFNVKTLADTQAPTVPAITSANAISVSQVNLSWSISTDNVGVDGYKVFRNGSEIKDTDSTNYSDTGLAPSTTYTYRVLAYDAKGNESGQSQPVSVTTNNDTIPPSIPSGLSSSNVTMNSLTLNWNASTDNVGIRMYAIRRNGTMILTTSATTFNDTGLAINTTYSYTVQAVDEAGNQSAESSPLSVTTSNDTIPPSIPAGLSGNASMTQIDLSWNASTDNIEVKEYRLYRDGDPTPIATIIDATSYSDTGLTQNTDYRYQISAVDTADNESAKSTAITVTTLRRRYGIADFTNLVADWLTPNSSSPANINEDNMVDSRDLGIMMSNWEDR